MNYLEIIGTLVGLIYLWLEYKASIWLWVANVIMPAIYVFIYYQAGLYADFGINIYYLIISFYGIFWWWKGRKMPDNNRKETTEGLPISHTPASVWKQLGIISIALLVLIAFILIQYTDSTVPWLDSFTTALSIVAMWMLARKYVEQWLVWIVVDAVSAGLYIYKELYFTAGLYALYTVIAYFGYKEWRRLMKGSPSLALPKGEGTENAKPVQSLTLWGRLEGATGNFAVIVGGGDFPTHPLPLQLMRKAERVVCCDGAANEFLARGLKPWRVVGDCDSLSPEAAEAFSDIVRRNPDQETNDQTKAVTYLTQKGIRRIAIVAATGRREDHTLGNISLLIEYMRQGLEVRIYTDYGVFIPCRDTCTFECPTGTAVSIFGFGTQGMTAEGLRYPLRDFTSWWQGTLNTADAPTFTIQCKGEYLVYLNY